MNLLLDTPIWIWSLLEPGHLKPKVTRALRDASNHLWLSPLSTWELLILVEKRRVHLKEDPIRWVEKVFQKVPFKEAPLNHRVVMESRLLDLPQWDPVDRFLAATALVYNLTLITANERLMQSNKVSILKNK